MTALVTQSEANLVMLARTAVGATPTSEVQRLLVTAVEAPSRLGPTARRLLEETLATGATLALVRSGGWKVANGKRLWHRYAPPKLHFGPNLIRLLQWMLKTPLGESQVAPLMLHEVLTPGEELIAALLFEKLKGTACQACLARQAVFRSSPLVMVMHPLELARALPVEEVPPIRVADHGVLLEGLRDLLARAWLEAERSKRELDAPSLVRAGRTQEAVLEALVRAACAVRDRALVSFLIDAAAQWLSAPSVVAGPAALNPEAPLRERTEARRAAGSFLRALVFLRGWDQEHRAVRFIDDDYEAAQQLVKEWEVLGDRGFREAARRVGELEALA